MRLDLGLDDEVDMTGGEHAIGVAVAAIAGQAYQFLDPREWGAVGLVHETGTRCVEPRITERGAGSHDQGAIARRPAVLGGEAVTGKALADEGLMHHPQGGTSGTGE